MYKYEICFKSGAKVEFTSDDDKQEIIEFIKRSMFDSGVIVTLNNSEIVIKCDEVVCVREVKQ